MQQYTTTGKAKAEAEYIFDGGDGMYAQYIFRRPEDTFYIVSERRYHDVPSEDEVVSVIRNGYWTLLS